VTLLEKPTGLPPIQMKSPKRRAQRNDVTPWAIAGGRRCTGAILAQGAGCLTPVRESCLTPVRAAGRARASQRCLTPRDQKKFTEPVALLSTSPGNLRLPPTALGSGFDLLALRARCTDEPTACGPGAQGRRERERRNLRTVPRAQHEIAIRVACSKGAG